MTQDEHNRAIKVLQEHIQNLTQENIRLEQTIQKIRFEIEQEADRTNAVVNADIAKGLYYAGEIMDKYTKGASK